MRQLGAGEPFEQVVTADDATHRDLLTGFTIATLVLSVPGAVVASLEIYDRLGRRRALAAEVETLKAALAEGWLWRPPSIRAHRPTWLSLPAHCLA